MKYRLILLILTVFIAPRLKAQISGNAAPCFGSQQIYSVNSSASSLVWTVTGGNISTVLGGNQLRVQWAYIGTYYVACRYVLGGTPHGDTLNIVVQPLPSPLITVINSQSGCQFTGITFLSAKGGSYGASNTCYSVCDSGLYAYAAKGWPGSTFSWNSTGSNYISSNTSGDTSWIDWANPLPPQHTILETTALTVVETSTAGCKDSTAICVGVNGKPHACFTSSPPDSLGIINICLGTTVSFNDSCSWVPEWYLHDGSIIDRAWIFGDGTQAVNQSLVNHKYNSAGNFTVKYIATSNCYCTDTVTKTVHVNASPGPDIECVSSVCHNTWSYYYVKDTCSHHFYWTVQGADSIRTSNDTLFVKWDSCNNGYGTVSVTTDCSSYCPYQTTVRVPVVPALANISGDPLICIGEQVLYSIPFVPSTFYQWYIDSVPFGHLYPLPSSNADQYTLTAPNRTRSYYLSASYANSFLGCSGNSTLLINVKPLITTKFINGDSLICQFDSLKLEGINSATSGAVLSNWAVYLASNDSLVDTLTNSAYYFSNTLTSGTYAIYTYPDTGIFCDVPYSNLVTVLTPPPPVAAPVIGQDTVCPNLLMKYYSLPTDASQYYLAWTAVNGTAAPRTGNGASVIWNSPLPDTLIVQQFMFQEPGCASTPLKITIYPFTAVKPVLCGDTTPCSDGIFSYKTKFQADNYTWSVSPPTSGSVSWGQGGDSISVQWNHFTADTQAQLILIAEKCSSPDTSFINIHIAPAPVPGITVSPSPPFCTGESLTFKSSIPGNRYVWNFGDGSTFTSNGIDTTHAFAADSSFVVTLTVDSPSGCMVNTTASVTVSPLPSPLAILTTPQPESYCGDGSFTNELIVTPQNLVGSSFSYSFFQTTSTTPIAGPTAVDSFAVTTIGSYYAVVSANGCSSNTDTINIDNTCFGSSGGTVCDNTYYINVSDTIFCDSIIFVASPSSNVTFSNWFFDDHFSATNTAYTTTASHIYTHAGYYHPLASGSPVSGTCMVVPGQLTVVIPLVPDFTVQFKCERGTMHSQLVDLSTYINPIISWNWSVGDTSYTTQNVDTPLTAGSHVIQLVISDGVNTCSISKTINVPAPAVASYTVVDNRCITLPIQFTSTSTGNIASYLWAFGDTSYSALQNTSKVYAYCYNEHIEACSERDTLTIMDIYGCQSSVTGTVGYYPDPFAHLTFHLSPQLIEACANVPEEIYLACSDPSFLFTGYTYHWSNLDSTAVDTLTINQSGNYSVTVSDVHSCTAAPAGAVSLIYNTVQGLIVGDKYYCYNEFSNLNIFQGYQYQYYWIYNSGGTNSTTLPATSHGYVFNKQMTGHYVVWGVIRDSLSPTQFCDDTLGPDTLWTYGDPVGNVGTSKCVDHQAAQFVARSTGNNFTLWNTGLVSDTLITSIPGVYTAEYIDTNGCIGTAEGVFTALGGPDFSEMIFGCYTYCFGDTPRLYVPQNLLTSTSRQWLLNGLPLGSSYTFDGNGDVWAPQSGAYQFAASSGGCMDTSQPIHINFTYCDSTCFKHANIFCSNCYSDSTDGKRYLSLIISIGDTIGAGLGVTVSSEQLSNITFWPNTLVPNSGTCYLNIRGVADSSAGSYCVEVSFGHCHQLFCLNAEDLSCSRLGAERSRRREDSVRVKPKYIKSYTRK